MEHGFETVRCQPGSPHHHQDRLMWTGAAVVALLLGVLGGFIPGLTAGAPAIAQEEFDVEDPFTQQADPEEGAQEQDEQAKDEEKQPDPWQVRIGNRAAIVHGNCQPLDFVILVPDEATFLEAISLWGFRHGRFPVLIEDDVYTPMFIRRFQPDRVFRWPSVGENTLPSGDLLRRRMLETVSWIWRHPEEERSKDDAIASGEFSQPMSVYQRAGWTPPGIVMTWENDPAWPAAVALAAGYGQPLVFLPDEFGNANDLLNPENWKLLEARVESLVQQTGYSYLELGDDIDTITIVREMAARYRNPDDATQILAVTDGLARRDDLFRWGIAGWIYGSSARSVYMAMTSLFITPHSAMCFDTYPEEEGYLPYLMNTVPAALQAINFEPAYYNAPDSTIGLWHDTIQNGFNGDVIMLNSSGNAEWFNLADGTRGYAVDVPVHNVPAWVYCVHSWSARRPNDIDTIAGRWIDNGAVAYVGAINEPYLQAFIPPGQLAERLKLNAPFIVSSRHEFTVPWKVMTIGDPLMTFVAKGRAKLLLSSSEITLPENLVDLAVLVGTQVSEANETGEWAPFFESCRKLGRDSLALRIYRKSVAPLLETPASERELEDERKLVRALHVIIPALAHEGELEELAKAIARIPKETRTRHEIDMLWAKANPVIDEIENQQVIETLMDSVRAPFRFVDASRLAPTVARTISFEKAQELLTASLGDVNANDTKALAMVEEASRRIHAIRDNQEGEGN